MNSGHHFIGFTLFLSLFVYYLLFTIGSPFYEKKYQKADQGINAYLTDPALFTEGPHVRFPALSDIHTPFREGPSLPEHTVSSMFIPPPSF